MKTQVFRPISLKLATGNQLTPAHAARKRGSLFRLPLLCLLTLLLAGRAQAGPDPVTVSNDVATAQGNQTSGIASGTGADFSSPPVTTLNVNSLSGAIRPGVNQAGISFANEAGGNVIIHSGVPGANVTIVTSGSGAGISAQSTGHPTTLPPPDPFLNIRIPTAASVPGGAVSVDSYSDITTTGSGAYGIAGTSQTTGFGPEVLTGLEDFTDTGFNFTLASVDGSSTNLGHAVQGVLVDTNGTATGGSGGTFIVNADGSFTFDLGNDFTNMAVGTTQQVIATYSLAGNSAYGTNLTTGAAIAQIIRTTNGFVVEQGAYSDSYGPCLGTNSVVPDLTNYVAGLVGVAKAGGAGNSVSITNRGSITTGGTAAHGIYAESQGGNGGTGRGGSISHSAGAGGAGQLGGNVQVQADGLITTTGTQSCAVAAVSLGGNGGNGGNGGFWRYGARGGNGTNGGVVSVTGNGTIHTYGDLGIGILAVSQGGIGGNGGNGKAFTGGGNGGYGGLGGEVDVSGNWNIATEGNAAHGIWAKSVGGNAGSGGSGGWIAGGPGGGGQATDGGKVVVMSGGAIDTHGDDAYGIYGQSIGGFGGAGGEASGIFYSAGGDGNSAGSGGEVDIVNMAGGTITNYGARAHAIYAQSVGGGGGSGGGGNALVGVGGSGAAGGNGGRVNVVNEGTLVTYGLNARGIYAQSIGGGGGDGGDSVGLVPIGGHGSATSDGGLVTVTNRGNIYSTANAIFAESIGGGGGSGGSSTGWFAVGGPGGAGGDANAVAVSNAGQLQTAESDASAIFAQSVGGGGGNGGGSVAAGAIVSLAIGGDAGVGGHGDVVTVVADTNSITTQGDRSHGILAQSVGGGGGNGGFAMSFAAGAGASLALGIGGNAAAGSYASNVYVTSASSITTFGTNAHGIFAQSVGGGGGSGGFSIAGSASEGFSGALSMGGKGGTGGNAGQVQVINTGDITTHGEHSYGLLAQSVGGGGGDGGFSVAGTLSLDGGASLSFGGGSGAGGNGAAVQVYNSGDITTSGKDAHAVFAQSVGGGGGSGGFSIAGNISGGAALGLSFGGSGSGGGSADNVILTSGGGTIITSGERSYGLLAQSVGGGGGDGGFSVAAGLGESPSMNFSMGGNAAGGGNGAGVYVTNASSIITSNANSHAIFAQSVGGGGGSGGFSVAGSLSVSGGAVSASLGGTGGGGGSGSDVVVQTTGANIATYGDHSYGVLAQSVGGGGGDGGFSVAGSIGKSASVSLSLGGSGGSASTGGDVQVDSSSAILTMGTNSHGLFAQSVGGGGGSGGFSVAGSISADSASVGASIGGSGGDGGSAGTVLVRNSGPIDTFGDHADGILAQSIGGGGGDGGFSVAGGISKGPSLNFAIGGSGGNGGSGSAVNVTSTSDITTRGEVSMGILAQSVGGGGGSGGFAVAGSISKDSGGLSFSLGGAGGPGSSAGNVNVLSEGDIVTTNQGSHAIVAQSIGGGGGNGGFAGSLVGGFGQSGANLSVSIGGKGGIGGSGGNVGVTNAGSIGTLGDDAYGILAQSIGGGGGNGGFGLAANLGSGDKSIGLDVAIGGNGATGGVASAVTVLNQNQITTYGSNSFGIFAQSVGGGGGNGGFSVAGSLSTSTNANQINVAVGGKGGSGNDSGQVIVGNYSNIFTYGQSAVGILAQSIGGGGGNGGESFAGSLTRQGSRTLAVAVGGSGGAGGSGNVVEVTNAGVIATAADDAHGIFAQSVGGGGGKGGSSTTIAWSAGSASSNSVSLNLDFSIGGSGGAAGSGSNVVVVNQGSIKTSGQGAYGIFAQSVGGGGGYGGDAKIEQKNVGLSDLTNLVSQVSPSDPVSDLSSPAATTNSSASESHSLSVNIGAGFGGKGGAAGDGGAVSINNAGDIVTHGANSLGIFAQSVGGGGGVGGSSSSETGGGSGDRAIGLNLNVGGAGGGGGGADTVTVTSAGSITTFGDDSHGIMAQSVGGGGGAGGASTSKLSASTTNTTLALNATVGIGGDGGVAGDGGNVVVTNQGRIDTSGRASYGILAQSIGGGGGFGGDATIAQAADNSGGDASANLAAAPSAAGTNDNSGEDKSWSLSVQVGSGGNAGSAGKGGMVTVNNVGDIMTRGTNSLGIFAQSVGGGGGVGGASGTETGGSGADRALDVGVSLGGKGGEGGSGDAVTVTSEGTITTLGDGAHAIMAQSVGGGGGAGGASVSGLDQDPSTTNASLNVTVGIGGSGNVAGNGGAVVVNNQGGIDTSGHAAYGILAQSIGGGGGFGGDATVTPAGGGGGETNSTAATGSSNSWNFNVSVALGGTGGASGAGGTVGVTNSGSIITRGDAAHGIFAQSVGGGGGAGGASVFAPATNSPASLNISLGGGGGSGNDGGTVNVVNQGNIETWGAQSYGILAQSIGGGGGRGGSAGITNGPGASNWSLNLTFGGTGAGAANGGDVTVVNTGTVLTYGDNAHGIFAQSVGGGGGDGGYGSHSQSDTSLTSLELSLGIVVGGSNGSSGNGGQVTVTQAGSVTTLGNGSFGVFAQSVGGGGGVGGAGVIGANGNIGIGGAGGAGGDGGDVTVNLQGDITTCGVGAAGIFAQSVGGGGGVAGDVDQGLATSLGGSAGSTNLGIGLAFGRSGGAGGNGGAVTLNTTGQIVTLGNGSCGIFAQSVGGGGGLAGSIGSPLPGLSFLNSAGSAGAAGSGGDINITHTGDIYTYGDNSHGIFMQSAGGQNAGGTVSLELFGSIHAAGTNSDAVYAQSVGGQSNGDISITLLNGSVEGGFGSGAGVRFSDGARNTLHNFSALSTRGDNVIVGGSGDETIENDGLVAGSVDLGSGQNAFYNHVAGRVESGANFNLGAGNQLLNAGVFAPGGQSAIQQTALTGNFLQTSTGVLQIKLGPGAVCDQLAVSGNALVGGTLSVSRFNDFLPAKADQFTVLTAGQSLSGQFASLADPLKGNYALMLQPVYFPNSITLQTLQDSFLQFAHTPNQRAVALDLDSVSGLGTMSGDPREAALIKCLNTIPGSGLGASFDLIAPEELGSLFDMSSGVADITALNIQARAQDLRSGHAEFGRFSLYDPHAQLDAPWAQQGDGSEPLPTEPSSKDWHAFALGSAQIIDVESTPNAAGYDIYTAGATLGADHLTSDNFGYGLTATYVGNKSCLANSGRVTVDGAHGGLFATWFGENVYLNGALGGGYNYFDTRRTSVGGDAVGSTDGYELDALLGGGYDLKYDRLTLGPVASLQYTYVNIAAFTETGSLAPLHIEDNDNNSLRSVLGGQVAYDFPVRASVIRPELQLGWGHEFLDTDHTIDSQFATGAGSIFSVHSPTVGRDYLAVGASVTVQWSDRLATYLSYYGDLASQNTSVHTFNVGLSLSL